jgi:hypothetical protein
MRRVLGPVSTLLSRNWLVNAQAARHVSTMTKATNSKTRLAEQLRANLARRKELVRARDENPEASSLNFREAPVHDPALRPNPPEK